MLKDKEFDEISTASCNFELCLWPESKKQSSMMPESVSLPDKLVSLPDFPTHGWEGQEIFSLGYGLPQYTTPFRCWGPSIIIEQIKAHKNRIVILSEAIPRLDSRVSDYVASAEQISRPETTGTEWKVLLAADFE